MTNNVEKTIGINGGMPTFDHCCHIPPVIDRVMLNGNYSIGLSFSGDKNNLSPQPAILQQAVILGCDDSDQRMVEVGILPWLFLHLFMIVKQSTHQQ